MSLPSRPSVTPRSRRKILQLGFAAVGVAGAGLSALGASKPAASQTARRQVAGAGLLAASLAHALRSIGTDLCRTAAARLDRRAQTGEAFSFALRGAGIDAAGARLIADALGSVSDRERAALTSFSLSYNPAIGDAGTIALARALPPTLGELGLVGCGFGDAGGEALFRWATAAPGLRMICIENNKLSAEIKSRISSLSDGPGNVFVVV